MSYYALKCVTWFICVRHSKSILSTRCFTLTKIMKAGAMIFKTLVNSLNYGKCRRMGRNPFQMHFNWFFCTFRRKRLIQSIHFRWFKFQLRRQVLNVILKSKGKRILWGGAKKFYLALSCKKHILLIYKLKRSQNNLSAKLIVWIELTKLLIRNRQKKNLVLSKVS